MLKPDFLSNLKICDRAKRTNKNTVKAKSGMVGSTKNAHALIIAIIKTVNISLYLIFFAMVKYYRTG